jgi:hypothetical protein
LILRNCRLIQDLTEDYAKPYADILIEEKELQPLRPMNMAVNILGKVILR